MRRLFLVELLAYFKWFRLPPWWKDLDPFDSSHRFIGILEIAIILEITIGFMILVAHRSLTGQW